MKPGSNILENYSLKYISSNKELEIIDEILYSSLYFVQNYELSEHGVWCQT